MPLYPWQCDHCAEKTEVLRDRDAYETEPAVGEDGSTKECSASPDKKHKWDRKIGVGQSWNRNYYGGKGNW